MNTEPEYKEGQHEEFIQYLFSDSPKEKGEISLVLPLPEGSEKCKNIGLHIFEQLLMIFVDGLKYFYGKDNKVDINKLTKEDFEKVNEYFISMNYSVDLKVFETMNDYQFKFPNYFKNQEHIKPETKLEDFYYEVFNNDNKAFRISFTNLV
jgi:hypothetical protein